MKFARSVSSCASISTRASENCLTGQSLMFQSEGHSVFLIASTILVLILSIYWYVKSAIRSGCSKFLFKKTRNSRFLQVPLLYIGFLLPFNGLRRFIIFDQDEDD